MFKVIDNILFEYIIIVIVFFLVNLCTFGLKNKKYNKKNPSTEISYLMKIYKVSVNKVNYQRLVRVCIYANTFIMSTVYILTFYLIKGIFWQLIIGSVLLSLLIIICYGLIGRYYMKGKKDV